MFHLYDKLWTCLLFVVSILASNGDVQSLQQPSARFSTAKATASPPSMNRRIGFQAALSFGGLAFGMLLNPVSSFAMSPPPTQRVASPGSSASATSLPATTLDQTATLVAFESISLPIPGFGVTVPVSCWFPTGAASSTDDASTTTKAVGYQYTISVKRIGQLLAGWDFIPTFASRTFTFPQRAPLVDGTNVKGGLPENPKVILLSHGFLGSRFDLSHLAESLAQEGFVCFSPEYPESLAASYERVEGLDRAVVNQELLRYIETSRKPSAYGIVGHSLGCGTALKTGDASWARVLIAGRPPADILSPLLFISSMNDGTVKFSGPLTIPPNYTILQEDTLALPKALPSQAALVFDRPDAPNHISYLSKDVNDAMIDFLSPLLPVAQALSIPVLDFDKYQQSQDSEPTAAIVKPLITQFLLEHMGEGSSK